MNGLEGWQEVIRSGGIEALPKLTDGSTIFPPSSKEKSIMPDHNELTMGLASKAFQMIDADAFSVNANLSADNKDSLRNFGMFESILLMAYNEGQQAAPGAAIADILTERTRQKKTLGWTPSHDDEHPAGQLADAGACYALSASGMPRELYENFWPWEGGFKPKGARNDLVRAAALLVAEIERLDRVANQPAI